jgi:hypothetical protein
MSCSGLPIAVDHQHLPLVSKGGRCLSKPSASATREHASIICSVTVAPPARHAIGLKRHAVTLFEGGRVSGEAVVSELTAELWASHAEGSTFEGDMARLAQVNS